MLRTRFTVQLGIEHPVVLAGMGGLALAELKATVSEAGALGVLGASPLQPERVLLERLAPMATA